MNDNIRKELLTMGDKKLVDFASGIIPGAGEMIGIRVPVLREYAKRIAKEQGEAALTGEDIYYEEKMLRGMIIGYMKTDTQNRIKLIEEYIPLIDNWALCDSFCPTLKFTKKNSSLMWDFIQPYLYSDKEFYIRFGIVMLLDYYINEEYIDRTLEAVQKVDTSTYYASMGAAWTLAECYLKYPGKTLPVIKSQVMDKATQNRTIQKLRDSSRVSREDKAMLTKCKIN